MYCVRIWTVTETRWFEIRSYVDNYTWEAVKFSLALR